MTYVAPQCQVHSCSRPSVAYCAEYYTFICVEHKAEFCDADRHRTESIRDGLERMLRELDSNIQSARLSLRKYRKDRAKYQEHLAFIQAMEETQ